MVGMNSSCCVITTPFMYIMSSLSLVKHVHFEVLHMQLKVHGGLVLSWGELLLVSMFVSFKWHVCVHDLSRLVSWWTTTSCLAILSTFRNLFHIQREGVAMCLCRFYCIVWSCWFCVNLEP
jgi:hypothetical protein